ncbi:MAG: DNA translocase FtsK [Candidatus Campbellbacteria bacterium]|nr:DNA translocase FtsK [Candidatus Campbellbacteria bacterium]
MSKKKRAEKKGPFFKLGLQEETRYAVLSVIFCVFGVFLLLSAFTKAGIVGEKVFSLFSGLLGVGYYLLPTLSFILAIGYFKTEKANIALTNIIGSLFFVASGLGVIELLFPQSAGYLGIWIAHPLVYLFATSGAIVVLVALFFISILVLSNTHPLSVINAWKRRRDEKLAAIALAQTDVNASVAAVEEKQSHEKLEVASQGDTSNTSGEKKEGGLFSFTKKKADGEPEFSPIFATMAGAYIPPPLSIFSKDSGKPGVGDIKANANIIKRTLQNFGIDVAMDEISIGPSVTRYAMKPAEGVRLSKILGLQKNLELALAAHPVRIEAPIPGKALVGIEVPNSAKTTVGLGNLLSTEEYTSSEHRLFMTLGRDVDGKAIFANLAKMPHILIAGTTGSGKSVTIHALINSLLFRNGPNVMRFVMIDPKRVELTMYNGIPHLLTPVITDPKKAILGLKWLVKEMERRYNVLEESRVRDIASYHSTILSPALERFKGANEELSIDMPETMPYIIVVMDELADIMSTYPRELEAGIVRLAQMSRAVGIHLIVSTQRPSVNVITGLIKANIPARIAMQVSSQIDSRTILDTSGAEKLLGAGDMLFMSGDMGKPKRIQSAFISEDEVKAVTEFLRKHDNGDTDTELSLDLNAPTTSGSGEFGDEDEIDDDLFEDARETVVQAGKASTSYLQRKLRIGYSRAARLMDVLEERGVIGPADGSKPRGVLVGKLGSETDSNESNE